MNKNIYNLKTITSILLICIVICCFLKYIPYNSKVILRSNETITKVIMMNGNNGSHVETSDNDKILELLNLLDNRFYYRSLSQNQSTGYSYYYSFYIDNKFKVRIEGSGDRVNINGVYYKVSKSIKTELLSHWFNSLDVKY